MSKEIYTQVPQIQNIFTIIILQVIKHNLVNLREKIVHLYML